MHYRLTNAARASRLGGARAERHIGAAQCEPTNLRLHKQPRGSAPRRRDARVLVLYAGGGGASSGISACEGFQVVAAVEKDSGLADLYRANHGHTVLELDLMNHAQAAQVLRQHGPFDMVQLSPPCVDFSVSGRCIEGRAAWLTVTAALLILDLGVPVLCIENVERMAKAAAWDIASEMLVDAGYALEQVVVDAADCGVAQNRRRLFVAGARTGRTADRWAQSVVEHWAGSLGHARTTSHPAGLSALVARSAGRQRLSTHCGAGGNDWNGCLTTAHTRRYRSARY